MKIHNIQEVLYTGSGGINSFVGGSRGIGTLSIYGVGIGVADGSSIGVDIDIFSSGLGDSFMGSGLGSIINLSIKIYYIRIKWVRKNKLVLYIMSKLTNQERLDLKKLLREADVQDNTEYIRRVKHSQLILNDLRVLEKLKRANCSDPAEQQRSAPFLYENYTDLFKKMVADELDLEIMSRLLTILKLIEDERVDQHEASVLVGKILKELYVDSALKKCKKMDEAQEEASTAEPVYKEEKPISWKQWSTKRAQIIENLKTK